ncbi:thiamine phosphate synthase [Thalassospira lucentensis]|uniref:thiamine phosphate synthase n=1 Tax=Thalassospira lucentensis TaxID=168935 RepID=UPI003AA9244B
MDDILLKQAGQLNLRNRPIGGPFPPVILLTDEVRLPDPLAAIAQLPRKSMVIFRHYDHANRTALAAKVCAESRRLAHKILIANDLALALKLGADGVHLPEYRILQTPSIFGQIPSGLIVTSACHSMATLRKLCLLPRDYRPDGVLISPVFHTQSHPGAAHMPFDRVQQVAHLAAQNAIIPIGLGGISRNTIKKLRGSVLASVAGIGFSVG